MRLPLVLLSTVFLAAACADDVDDLAPDARLSGDAALSPDAHHMVDARLPDAGSTPDAPPATTGSYTHYVTNSLSLGANALEAASYGFDVDGDGEKDNALGVLLATFGGALNVDERIDEAVQAGDIILLHSLRADSLINDAEMTWRVLVGSPQANPNYTGTGSFTVAPTSPQNAILPGAITAGAFVGGPATVTLELALLEGQPPVRVRLVGARASAATVNANLCTGGRLGGAITSSDIETMLIPALAAGLDAIVAADDGCRQSRINCSASTQLLLTAFDSNGDRIITVSDLEDSILAQALFAADVDMLDGEGNPGHDGELDSVSLAVAFTCVKATFSAPGE